MQSKTKSDESKNGVSAIKIARQVRALKRAVLHNVEHGVTDMPAKGLLSPFTVSLEAETVKRLNQTLSDYDVQIDAYKMKVRGKAIDRIAVVQLDNASVEPSPAYQAALQHRYTLAV